MVSPTLSEVGREFTVQLMTGVKDSFHGLFMIYRIDKDLKQRAEEDKFIDVASKSKRTGSKSRESPTNEPRILNRMGQCCAWNGGIFCFSILTFHYALIPLLWFVLSPLLTSAELEGTAGATGRPRVWAFISGSLSFIFHALWILPLFILSKLVNSLWFQDIADAAYRRSKGRPPYMKDMSRLIADVLSSLLLQTLFLIQAMLFSMVPLFGFAFLAYVVHISLLYSLYAFEYKWFSMGLELERRVVFIETHWPYFLGFGLPLAILTSIPESFLVSGSLFAMIFPFLIVSGNEAKTSDKAFQYKINIFSLVMRFMNWLLNTSVPKKHPKH